MNPSGHLSLLPLPPIVIGETSTTTRGVTTLLALLVAVVLVAFVTRFIRVPYTIALVVVGLALGITGGPFQVSLSEDVILTVFLPALLFEAAYNLPWKHLRAEFRFISGLAIPGVLVSTLVVGAIMHLAGLAWLVALLFGALISATDPVSVLAIFKQLKADRRLATVVEAESLFNDGTALVIFQILLGVIVAGRVAPLLTGLAFVVSIIGGVAVGAGLGYLTARLLRTVDDYLIEITCTLLLAYGTFILTEHLAVTVQGVRLGASPVIAVVVAGLVIGNYAAQISMSETTRAAMDGAWELITYLANSYIFLLIGLQIHRIPIGRGDLTLIFWAVVSILVARALIVYGGMVTLNLGQPRPRRFPLRYQHIVVWGGLRGAVALAAALSIPDAFVPERATLLLLTFAIVLFTLLVQGMTIRPLVRWFDRKPE